MEDINSIDDIRTLVYSFYKRVMKDDLLEPIFSSVVKESQWPDHLEIMVTFWQTNILFEQSYKGNPLLTHIKVDALVNHSITIKHFDRWLQLWSQTIDEIFSGNNAGMIKKRAEDMAKLILYKIEQSRKNPYLEHHSLE